MISRNHLLLAVGLLSSVLIPAPSMAQTQKGLPEGLWAGKHISMNVTAQETKIDFDCAHGIIPSAIVINSRGRFVVEGRYVEEHGGPVQPDDESRGIRVRFTGNVTGKKMNLMIKRVDNHELIGSFILMYGQEASLVKCK